MVNTVVLTASVVIISVVLGLALAMLLDRRFIGRGLARAMLIAPSLVMPVAAAHGAAGARYPEHAMPTW